MLYLSLLIADVSLLFLNLIEFMGWRITLSDLFLLKRVSIASAITAGCLLIVTHFETAMEK